MSAEAPHLSIGEVLAQLRDEFPDVTISKIRFLESQGLIDPERTASGYRKFYDDDLVRLRWILFQQKEHFLPLKVIKERLDELPPGDLALLDPARAELAAPEPPDAEPPEERAEAQPEDAAEEPAVAEPVPAPAAPSARDGGTRPQATVRPRRAQPARRPAFAPVLPLDDADDDAFTVADAGDTPTLGRAELAAASGLDDAQLAELESFGLIRPVREQGGAPRFDEAAVEVAQVAAGFFRRGVEARHLRMYRTSAEREAVLFAQVLLPYMRQRNPEARARVQDELVELATLGRRLRTVLLREAAGETLAE
jgi:DNA-binding transcriptional MerR regulator